MLNFNKTYLENIIKLENCTSDDVTRYALCGVQQKGNDLVATDGHKLVLIKTESACNVFWPNEEIKKLKSFLKLCKHVQEFEYDENTKLLKGGVESISLALIFDNNYPNYEPIIPKTKGLVEVKFNAEYLLQIAKALSESKTNSVTLFIDTNSKMAPIVIESYGHLGVLMPMR